ncbi:MAG: hypothetical protein MK098_02330 [Marinovum sp.]|nr:hypothetical protein [Marinovum sp.]
MIVLAVALDQFGVEIPIDFGEDVAKFVDSRLRQLIAAVFWVSVIRS